MADPLWPQFDAGRLADEYMPSSADVLAEIQAAERRLREQHGERITRITVSPVLTPWLRRKFPAADPPLIPAPWAGLAGIPIVEDASFVNGRLRIHRGDTAEDWFAVPPDEPERLIRFKEPVIEFPRTPFVRPPRITVVVDERVQPGTAVAIDATGKAHVLTNIGTPPRPWWRRIWRRR